MLLGVVAPLAMTPTMEKAKDPFLKCTLCGKAKPLLSSERERERERERDCLFALLVLSQDFMKTRVA